MNEFKRTMIFAAVAVLVVSVAGATHYFSRPAVKEGFERVGSEFYPDFKDPSLAARLHVEMYNEETSEINTFDVALVDGVWRIPSRYNYPVDGKDRLAKTAASVIGMTRGALVSRREGDFEKYGVIDPMDQQSSSLKGRGHRITLYGKNNEVLADYVIGKKTPGEQGSYYVRAPLDEQFKNETYLAKLNIDLSTRFSDWIEPDLLKIDRGDLRDIVVNKYTIDREHGRLVGRETNHLNRKSFNDKWALDGLKAETEEVNADAVNAMVGDLDNLRIVGVRPKPAGLNPDLTIDRKVIRDQLAVEILGRNMAAYGFFVGDDNGAPKLFSNEGELVAATDKGAVYHLNFGEVFVGTDYEMEFGASKDGDKKDVADNKDAAGDKKDAKPEASKSDAKQDADKADAAKPEAADKKEPAKADEKGNGETKKDSKLKNGRYVFVNVLFDESKLGPAPQKPVEPTQPAAEKKPEPEKKPDPEKKPEPEKKSNAPEDAAKKATDAPKNDAKKADATAADAPKSDPAKAGAKPAEKKAADPKAQYDEAMKKYQADLPKYELDLKDHQKKIEEGRKNVDALSKRFAGWYYVISAESFENLRLARSGLVKPKEEKKDGAPPTTPPGIPGLPLPGDDEPK